MNNISCPTFLLQSVTSWLRLPSVFMTFLEWNKKIFAKKRSVIFPTSIHSHFSPLVKIIYLFFAFFFTYWAFVGGDRKLSDFFSRDVRWDSISVPDQVFFRSWASRCQKSAFSKQRVDNQVFWDEVCARIGVRVLVFGCVCACVRVSVWERAFQRNNSVCVTLIKTHRVSNCEYECKLRKESVNTRV